MCSVTVKKAVVYVVATALLSECHDYQQLAMTRGARGARDCIIALGKPTSPRSARIPARNRPRNHARSSQLSNWPQGPEHHHDLHFQFFPAYSPIGFKMAPKSRVPEKSSAATSSAPKANKSGSVDAQEIVQGVWNKYVNKTPQRVKLLDSFMVFLIVVGVLQFAYCLIVGNFVCIFQGSLLTADLATTCVLSGCGALRYVQFDPPQGSL